MAKLQWTTFKVAHYPDFSAACPARPTKKQGRPIHDRNPAANQARSRQLLDTYSLELDCPLVRVGQESQLAVAGGISLLCWLTAITADRMIGY